MKRILITVILTIICFGIGVTSFAVNDLSNLTTWYRVEVRPAIEKAYHDKKHEPDAHKIFRLCDTHIIPLATNLATAELLIKSLERGELDWREMYKK